MDIYQLHCVPQCYEPGDGTGMYECLKSAKQQGIVKHIGVTAHNIETAFKCVNSGLYETMQFPFSYLCSAREIELVNLCKEKCWFHSNERTCRWFDSQFKCGNGIYFSVR